MKLMKHRLVKIEAASTIQRYLPAWVFRCSCGWWIDSGYRQVAKDHFVVHATEGNRK